MKRISAVLFSSLLPLAFSFAQGTWQSISSFGTNPGNISAYKYVPAGMPADAPLVVVMHGCTQNATSYSSETGWNTLADFHKFYVVHAEQKSANNSSSCFNYWEPGDHSRGQGEALSIKQMVDYMKSNYSIDNSRVFATGLSAGGAMTAVMLSAYPDVFAAGAEMAGLPYKVATSSLEVLLAATGLVSKTPQQWGDLVRAEYPGFTGSYPRLAVFHGTSDIVINENNATEIVKQFTNLHGTNQNADNTVNSFAGNASVQLMQYENAAGDVVVERYTLSNMAHGIAVDPGPCFTQGGGTGSNAIDINFFSSYYAAEFFGILKQPFVISGNDSVYVNEQGVMFSVVPNNASSAYSWTLPAGATIAGGAATGAITVNWGNASGTVRVTETASNGCVTGPVELFVTALPLAEVTIAGVIRTEAGAALAGVKVKLTGSETDSIITAADGSYQFDVASGGSYTVTPSKNNDSLASSGITTLDVLLMQRHILASGALGSPYKIIAAAQANAEADTTVSTLDIVFTRSMILANRTSYPTARLWQFVSSDYVFAEPTRPFPFDKSRAFANITSDETGMDFIGIKLGDVNDSWNPAP